MGKRYLLRMEGVNLDNFVYDTNDLATIRGGSWLLLDAPKQVEKFLSNHVSQKITLITQGASWGLLEIIAEENDALSIVSKVRKFLAEADEFKHATFVVDILPCEKEEEFSKVRDRLEALNKQRQLQSPSVICPALSPDKLKGNVCQFDYVSPAVEMFSDQAMGASVKIRREKGRAKQQWYLEICGLKNEKDLPSLAPDFSTIACSKSGVEYGSLDGKMAVIYLDGNGFGKKQRDFCKTIERQKQFDQDLRVRLQNSTLRTLLKEISKKKNWVNNGWDLRLETLLWGGDEICWVVPAWQGWWFLARFFQEVKAHWTLDGEPLTLGGGLVFCSHKAPIHRITALAKKLGDMAKGDRSKNRIALQVLESFDSVGEDFNSFRNKQYTPPGIAPSALVIDGESMMNLLDSASFIKDKIPKRQLYRLVSLFYHPNSEDEQNLIRGIEGLLVPGEKEVLNACLGSGKEKWLLFLELWDYLDNSFNK